jgi:SOS-response transcriptional repressor LexA
MVQLTELQGKVVAYILQCLDKTGMPPTLREIAAHFEWKAVGSAQDVVNVLRKKGFLNPPVPGKSRQLVPTAEAFQWWSTQALQQTTSQSTSQAAPAWAETSQSGRATYLRRSHYEPAESSSCVKPSSTPPPPFRF